MPDFRSGDAIYRAVQMLVPIDAVQGDLKAAAADLTLEIGQDRALLASRALQGAPTPLLVIVVCWLIVILFGFSVLAPRNVVATVALIVAAAAVSGAILLMLEFYQPFEGLIQISSEPMVAAISRIPKLTGRVSRPARAAPPPRHPADARADRARRLRRCGARRGS